MYLNVDMVASPNAGYFAQGGEGDEVESAGPAGSATVGRELADELARTGVATPEAIEFVGDDESPFIDAGIPVGGAENGDRKRKTARPGSDLGWPGGPTLRPVLPHGHATASTTSTMTCSTTTSSDRWNPRALRGIHRRLAALTRQTSNRQTLRTDNVALDPVRPRQRGLGHSNALRAATAILVTPRHTPADQL